MASKKFASKKIAVLGIAAGMALVGANAGMAEAKFDSVNKHTGAKQGTATAELASDSSIADDGVFTVTASAKDAVDAGGTPSEAFSDVTVTKQFALEPGKYQAKVALHDLFGDATHETFGGSKASVATALDCATCTNVATAEMNVVQSLPLQSSIVGEKITAVTTFTVTEATTVTLTTTIAAVADTSTGVVSPYREVWLHGSGTVSLTGLIGDIEIAAAK